MDTSKEGIKAWLSKYPDRDRNWLADQCEVEKRTVDNWLSSPQNIPSKAILIIEGLMRADEESQPGKPMELVNLPVECSPDQFDLYTRAFRHSEQEHFRDWIISRLDAAADLDLSQSAGGSDNVRPFPVKPNLIAAAGLPVFSEVTEWNGANDTVVVKIAGLSMEPLLHDGDVITMRHKRVSRNPYMRKGLIYLVDYDGGYTVKRYNTRPARPEEQGEEWVEKGKVKVLESINPAFPEIIIKQPLEWIAWLEK